MVASILLIHVLMVTVNIITEAFHLSAPASGVIHESAGSVVLREKDLWCVHVTVKLWNRQWLHNCITASEKLYLITLTALICVLTVVPCSLKALI